MTSEHAEGVARLRRRGYLRTAGALAAAGTLAGCAGLLGEPTGDDGEPSGGAAVETRARPSGDPVRLGVSLPFTGAFAEEGPEMILGYEFWRREVEAAGGLLGRPVELVVYDDESTREGAAAAYERLVDEDEVDLPLGTVGTLGTAGAVSVLEERGMPCAFPHAWGPLAWDREREWTVPLLPIAGEVPRGLVAVLADLGVDSFAVIESSSGYARDLTVGLVEFLEDAGIEVVEAVEYPRGDGAARREALRTVADAGADAIGCGGSVAEVRPLVRAVGDLDVSAEAFAWFDFDDNRLFSLGTTVEGMLGTGIWTARAGFPGNDRFVEEFSAWAGSRRPDWSRVRLLQHHSPAAYSGALVLQRAVEAAGTVDPAPVRDALWDLETGTPNGRFAVDDEGYQVGKEMLVCQYQRGLREIVWPPEYETADATLSTIRGVGGSSS